jgi:hypothetical protein
MSLSREIYIHIRNDVELIVNYGIIIRLIIYLLANILIRLIKRPYSTTNPIHDYQTIIKEKFLTIVQSLENVPGTKQLFDQLSDASLAVWDTLLLEIEFSQIFSREMIKLSDNGLEKALLFFNRIRIQLGFENNQKFFKFFQTILKKIPKTGRKSAEQLNKLFESIHYQQISFEQAKKMIRNFHYPSWSKEIEKRI